MFEIGNSLKVARERQGLEFPQVEAATKIRGKYLRALEDEQFEQLPAETYVKGFLRTYAEYLGLDGQLYVDEYNSRFVTGEEGPAFRPRRSPPRRTTRGLETNVVLFALTAIAVMTALVIAAWKSGASGKQNIVGLSPPAASSTKTTHRAATIVLRAVRKTSLLSVRVGGPTGRVVLSNTPLAKGESKHFTARRLWINTGTPENLRITVNGKRVAAPFGPRPFVVTAHGVQSA